MTFASFKNARIVRSGWLGEGGRRLDCNPYMSGALEARDTLKQLKVRKDALATLTKGHAGGIYNGPVFARIWVDDPRYGVPFLSNSDMLNADLANLPLLQRRYAESKKLAHLELSPGTTLITCSGTIGRMTYVRPDMAGMWSSQHIMKVVPDPERVPAGYLYAYLSSRYGVPLVVSGTYGAIIQHIEPEHIAGLPVPRFAPEVEQRIGQAIVRSASLRDEASRTLKSAIAEFLSSAGLQAMSTNGAVTPFSVSSVCASSIQRRCDGFFHSRYHMNATEAIKESGRFQTLAQFTSSIVEPNRFKRVVLDADSGGVPLFGTSSIFWSDPEASYYLPRKLAEPYIVSTNTLLVPRSGQLQGVIGCPVLPYGDIIGGAVSEDAIRINCHTPVEAGLLFVFLTSDYGLRQLKARAFGSSIPHLDVRQIGECLMPELDQEVADRIGRAGLKVSELRSEALRLEREARRAVEEQIEGSE
ncbi:methylation-associated defense system restriction endonuclease subunit S MAD5 [Ralstonia insidiosa]|uniref:Restriction endonuclease subunit S n=1 Tax=Ralstonia insidiosa TaxID=190721 RepID=A0A848P1T5_9RALS|nr:restriction endonuclease subunit S [Ralstonia insidiosa]NMV38614.1 restriction endonuclease subunit S [Ralstonia insidiosa]